MLAHKIHAVNILLFRNKLQFARSNAVTRTAERFGHDEFLSRLRRNRAYRFCGNFSRSVASQIVYRRDMLVKIARRAVGSAPHLREEKRFLNAMPREQNPVTIAPIVKPFIVIFAI